MKNHGRNKGMAVDSLDQCAPPGVRASPDALCKIEWVRAHDYFFRVHSCHQSLKSSCNHPKFPKPQNPLNKSLICM